MRRYDPAMPDPKPAPKPPPADIPIPSMPADEFARVMREALKKGPMPKKPKK